MNPEFRRNLWLEMTPRRMVMMVAVLALIFFAVAVSGGKDYHPEAVAETLYYLIVVLWGARNAALSVVGEIRDRTWDLQRLSSIGPEQMTWGKLFGSTIYNWFGGAICLAIVLAYRFAHDGPGAAVLGLVYFLEIGVIAQASALLASLIAVNRRQRHSRFEVFVYQMVGVAAAIATFLVWQAADPESAFLLGKKATDTVMWWGHVFGSQGFLLASLAIFTVWIFVGCYREMRVELRMTNGPLVWLGFLLFIGSYVAGFDAWLSQDKTMASWDNVALRLALVATSYAVLTYIMVWLEPKDRVLMRWLGAQFGSRQWSRGLSGLQAWMMSYIATLIVSVVLLFWLNGHEDAANGQAMILAVLGFLTRDTGIFVLSHTWSRRRGDFPALLTLFSLYVLIPAILNGLGLDNALFAFFPKLTTPLWLCFVVPLAEGLGMWVLAITRISLVEKTPGAVLQAG